VLFHFHIFLHAVRSLTHSHFLVNSSCLHLYCSVRCTTTEWDLSVLTSSLPNILSYATPSSKPRQPATHFLYSRLHTLSPVSFISHQATKLLFTLIHYLLSVSCTRC
jgi:hypothetical protein